MKTCSGPFQAKCSKPKKKGCSSCSPMGNESYPIPAIGKKNLKYKALKSDLRLYGQETVYAYIITTIFDHDGVFRQEGSAPNFEGGVCTLCTCKHWMRTYQSAEKWRNGFWVAGFSSLPQTGQHNLLYIMRIAEAHEDYFDLWKNSKILTADIKKQKSASNNILGDLYEPLHGDHLNSQEFFSYKPPVDGHVHTKNDQIKDIRTKKNYKKTSSLLVGDPGRTYTWDTPLIQGPDHIGRNCNRWTIADFLTRIENQS